MDRKEAIETIKAIIIDFEESKFLIRQVMALKIAIKSLEEDEKRELKDYFGY